MHAVWQDEANSSAQLAQSQTVRCDLPPILCVTSTSGQSRPAKKHESTITAAAAAAIADIAAAAAAAAAAAPPPPPPPAAAAAAATSAAARELPRGEGQRPACSCTSAASSQDRSERGRNNRCRNGRWRRPCDPCGTCANGLRSCS
uniref:Uncharacterized protein n=1 Tax=Tetradesmus obliquus TaxID=3088 RepID=A0A383VKK9_TETOB